MTQTLQNARRGAAAIMILMLTTLMFIAIVFSIDIARIQLAQMELQSGVDLATRAGSEALSRGVGEGSDFATMDSLVRDEIDMIAKLNTAAGEPIALNVASAIEFGKASQQANGKFSINILGAFNGFSDCVKVTASLPNFPVVFGGFVSRESVSLTESSISMVRERDIVVVLDRSASMLTHDAGSIPESEYHANLRALEDDIYGPGEAYYPGGMWYTPLRSSEFEASGGMLNLSRTQALKLAVLKFRDEIDASRSREFLGLTSYSDFADTPAQSTKVTQTVNIHTGIPSFIRNQMVGDGITYGDEHYASALESNITRYRNFDYNYLAMRRNGWTNIVDGLEKGNSILFGPGHRYYSTPVLILMTDGIHNQAGDPLTTASNLMAANPQMKIYTVTFGAGADQVTMADIATIGNGEHLHANNVNELVTIFKKLATSAGVTLIQ